MDIEKVEGTEPSGDANKIPDSLKVSRGMVSTAETMKGVARKAMGLSHGQAEPFKKDRVSTKPVRPIGQRPS